MNYDRLLTRVFDKSLKEMIYSDRYMGLVTAPEAGILFYDQTFEPFNDRFVPMMCWGEKDKAGKLFYESDIIKYWLSHKNKFVHGIIKWDGCLYIHSLEKPDEYMNIFTFDDVIENKCEIIGNCWEQPELMEVKA